MKGRNLGVVGAKALERSTSWSSTRRSTTIRVPANCWFYVRSDSPFTKRSGDMVYTSVLD